MIDTIVEMFSYPFMVRAFAVGSLVALCAALLGVRREYVKSRKIYFLHC